MGLKISTWRQAFDSIKEYRRDLKQTDGVLLRSEIHARELVKGKGRLGPQMVTKYRRSRIFYETLELIASLPDVHIINICLDVPDRRNPQLDAWDRLLNRINRTCDEMNRRENANRRQLLHRLQPHVSDDDYSSIYRRLIPYSAHAFVIADEGHEAEIIRLKRKLTVFNHVPSRLGAWSGGSATKNIPLTHFVEDTLFRESAHSYLTQMADCAAFALLKREVDPTPVIKRYNIHKAWDAHLAGVSFQHASRRDPDGIVRK